MALYGKIKAKLIGKPFCTMVVLAAGSSKRMGRDKLMMEVGGVPVLVRSLQAMQDCAAWTSSLSSRARPALRRSRRCATGTA